MDYQEWKAIGAPWFKDGKIVGECRWPPCQHRYDVALALQNVRLAREAGAPRAELEALRSHLRQCEKAMEREEARRRAILRKRAARATEERAREAERAALEEAVAAAKAARENYRRPSIKHAEVGRGKLVEMGIPRHRMREFRGFLDGAGQPIIYAGNKLWIRDASMGEVTGFPMCRQRANLLMQQARSFPDYPCEYPHIYFAN